jgi:hypothetical protein
MSQSFGKNSGGNHNRLSSTYTNSLQLTSRKQPVPELSMCRYTLFVPNLFCVPGIGAYFDPRVLKFALPKYWWYGEYSDWQLGCCRRRLPTPPTSTSFPSYLGLSLFQLGYLRCRDVQNHGLDDHLLLDNTTPCGRRVLLPGSRRWLD